ncbi:MAG: hypothetical protein AB8G11_22430 [Saprospiraceae bacterium]
MDDIYKITKEISRVDNLIKSYLTSMALGKPIDRSKYECLLEYLMLLRYLLFKSIQLFEINRFEQDCVECELDVSIIECSLDIDLTIRECNLEIEIIG